MRKEWEKFMPNWHLNEKEYKDLVLSDDMDSLLACSILEKVRKRWSIGYYYNFEGLYKEYEELQLFDDDDITRKINAYHRVWVDVAVNNRERAFDNHVSLLSWLDKGNELTINPNLIYPFPQALDLYQYKYAGSTSLLIYSIFGYPLPKTEKGKMLLLCIDSAYLGFYSNKFVNSACLYLRDMLGLSEFFDVISRHTKLDFDRLAEEYKINEKFRLEDGYLKTDIDLKAVSELLDIDIHLPDCKWDQIKKFKQIDIVIPNENYHHMVKDQIDTDMYTAALVYNNKLRYSKEIKDV